jgi:2-keto-4-pentenoate hydratase/2-oxohepta-3-ene-1,7-dioic acid hydratase in catechol pathway
MIWMGTDGTSPDLKAGDVVEVEIAGIGTLRNPFVSADAHSGNGAKA